MTRPGRKVTAMFIDIAFGSPIYERLRSSVGNCPIATAGLSLLLIAWDEVRRTKMPFELK
jgi:hypothetical protein